MKTGIIKSEFHSFVRPIEKPILSQYCLNLTGIKQDKVDSAPQLQKVLSNFDGWLTKVTDEYDLKLPNFPANNGASENCAFITWTNFDINFFLASECKRKSIPMAKYFDRWINLKGVYRGRFSISDSKKCTFTNALKFMHMDFEGQQHSGLDDSRNLALLTYKLLQMGVYLKWNGQLQEGSCILRLTY